MNTTKQAAVTATWILQLFAECPHCLRTVDLLELPNFWDGYGFQPCEHMTPRTTATEVTCPKCGHQFKCDLTY